MQTSKTLSSRQSKLSIIIVNYQSEQYLGKCLASLYANLPSAEIEIILVNNDATEDLRRLQEKYPATSIVVTEKNLGFGRASNLGAKQATGTYLLFLNPDTEMMSADLEKMTSAMEQDKQSGITGVKIINQKNEEQAWTVGFRELDLWDVLQNNLPFLKQKKHNQSIFWVTGAAFIIKKELFQAVEGFDEDFFLYFEDVDLCRRVRARGKKIQQTADMTVKHVEGGSQKNKRKQKQFFYASQDYYFKKHFSGPTAWTVRWLRKIVS